MGEHFDNQKNIEVKTWGHNVTSYDSFMLCMDVRCYVYRIQNFSQIFDDYTDSKIMFFF